MKRWLVLFACLAFATTATAAGKVTTQHYKNQRGSTLTLKFHPAGAKNGTISGSFTTAVASRKCRGDIGKAVPVTGYYNGDALSVTASYPKCGAILAYVGNRDKQNELHTLWILTRQAAQPDGQNWNTRVVGHDEFKPVA